MISVECRWSSTFISSSANDRSIPGLNLQYTGRVDGSSSELSCVHCAKQPDIFICSTLQPMINELPNELMHLVFDFLDDWSLIRFHFSFKHLRHTLPGEFPLDLFKALAELRSKALEVIANAQNCAADHFRSASWCMENPRYATILLREIGYIKKYLLREMVAPHNPFARKWTKCEVTLFVHDKPLLKDLRWYHSRQWPLNSKFVKYAKPFYVAPSRRQLWGEHYKCSKNDSM